MFPSGNDATKLPAGLSGAGGDSVLQSLAVQQQLLSLLSALQQQQQPSAAMATRLSGTSTQSSFPSAAAFHPLLSSLGLPTQPPDPHTAHAAVTPSQQHQAARLMGIAPHNLDSQSPSMSELSRRRPSLMSNFAPTPTCSAPSANTNDLFSSFMYSNAAAAAMAAATAAALAANTNGCHGGSSPAVAAAGALAGVNASVAGAGPVSLSSDEDDDEAQGRRPQNMSGPQDEVQALDANPETESLRRECSERLEKIRREQVQLSSTILSSKHKTDVLGKTLITHGDHRQNSNSGSNSSSNNNHNGVESGAVSNGAGPEDDVEEEEDDEDAAMTLMNDASRLIDKVYADNRRIAASTALPFAKLKPVKEADDVDAQEETRRCLDNTYERGIRVLPALINAMRLQRRRDERQRSDAQSEYATQLSAWAKKVAKAERNPKKVARDARHREIFEKTFVELKKQREEKERNSRVERSRSATLSASGAPDGVFDNEMEAKARAVAIIPPPFAARPSRPYIDNRNGLVEDALADTRNRIETFLNNWTDTEKEIFDRKIAAYGKNFAAIAAFLQSKSVRDCVLYYYITKKRVNYKLKFGRKRKKIGRQYRPPVMPQLGDIFAEEGYSAQNVGRDGVFVECLLCGSRMSIFMGPASRGTGGQPGGHCAVVGHFYDDGSAFVGGLAGDTSQQDLHNQIPICAKCISSNNKNKAANRCPLGTCGCGKRKTKPARSVPEKFHSLSVENKRFVVFRLKIPPTANKCCNACFRRIQKEIEHLMDGQLKEEQEEFNQRVSTFDARQKQEQLTRRQELGFAASSAANGELLLENKFLANLTEIATSALRKSAVEALSAAAAAAAAVAATGTEPVAEAKALISETSVKIEATNSDESGAPAKATAAASETLAGSSTAPSFGVSSLLAEDSTMEVDGAPAAEKSHRHDRTHHSPPRSKEIKLELDDAAGSEAAARRVDKRVLSAASTGETTIPKVAASIAPPKEPRSGTSTPGTPSRAAAFGSITQGTPLMRAPEPGGAALAAATAALLDSQQQCQQQNMPDLLSVQQQLAALQQFQLQQELLMRAGNETKNLKDLQTHILQLQQQQHHIIQQQQSQQQHSRQQQNHQQQQQRQNTLQLPFQLAGNCSLEDALAPGFATSLLAHFGVSMQSKDAADELSRKLQQNPEILAMLQKIEQFKQQPHHQPQQQHHHQQQQQQQRPSLLASQQHQPQQQQQSLQLNQQLDLPISALFGQSAGAAPTASQLLYGGASGSGSGTSAGIGPLASHLGQLGLSALAPAPPTRTSAPAAAAPSEAELLAILFQNPAALANPFAQQLAQQQQKQPQQQLQQQQQTVEASLLGGNPMMLMALRALAEQQQQQQQQQQQISGTASTEAKFLEQQAQRHLLLQQQHTSQQQQQYTSQQQQKLLFESQRDSPKLAALRQEHQRSPVVSASSMMRSRAATSPRISAPPVAATIYASPSAPKPTPRNFGQGGSSSYLFGSPHQRDKSSPIRIQQLAPNSRSLTSGRAAAGGFAVDTASGGPDGSTGHSPAVDVPSLHDPMKRKSGLATAILPSRSPNVALVGQNAAGGDAQISSIQAQYLPPKPQRVEERKSPADAASTITTTASPSIMDADRFRTTRIFSPSSIASPQRQTPNRGIIGVDRTSSSSQPDVAIVVGAGTTPPTPVAAIASVVPSSCAAATLPTLARVAEELLLARSASVKAESNCGGGVSSSCYESLSEDEGDESADAAAANNSLSPSGKLISALSENKTKESGFENMGKASDAGEDSKPEMFYYNVLTLSAGSPPKTEPESSLIMDTTSSSSGIDRPMDNVFKEPMPSDLAEQQSQTTVRSDAATDSGNKPPTLPTTCIYEPLSDDDD